MLPPPPRSPRTAPLVPSPSLFRSLAAYAFSPSGALACTFPDLLNNDRLRINYLLLAVSAAAAVAFARSFFEERIFTPWLARACTATIVALLGTAALFAGLAPWRIALLDRLSALAFKIGRAHV